MRRAIRQVGEGGAKLSLRKAAEKNDVSFSQTLQYVTFSICCLRLALNNFIFLKIRLIFKYLIMSQGSPY
jgi:hypothetical protein